MTDPTPEQIIDVLKEKLPKFDWNIPMVAAMFTHCGYHMHRRATDGEAATPCPHRRSTDV